MTGIARAIARLLLAPALVVAAAIVVKSSSDVGDGFAAGVVVALVVALNMAALGADEAVAALPLLRHTRALVVSGVLLAMAAGFFPVVAGEPPFSHLPPPGVEPVSIGSLSLTTSLAFVLGVFLLVVGVLVALLRQFAAGEEPS